jgi:diacylglycerol kinase (ATP)
VNEALPRLHIIFNPLAGPADLGPVVERAAGFWRNLGWETSVQATEYAGHAEELARQAASQRALLVLSGGGDGTLRESASGLIGSRTILGLLPMGTGNSFAKELHMPRPGLIDHRALEEASALLAGGRVYEMDVGKTADGRYWLLWAGSGLDGYLVSRMEPRSKLVKRLGPVGYAVQAIFLMPRFRGINATISVDDEVIKGAFAMVTVANCRRFAGGILHVNQDARLDDGQFEIWLIKRRSFLGLLRLILAVLRRRHNNHPDFARLSGRRIRIETDVPAPVQVDGDPGGATPFECHVRAGALRMLIPSTAPAGLFCQPGKTLAEVRKEIFTH